MKIIVLGLSSQALKKFGAIQTDGVEYVSFDNTNIKDFGKNSLIFIVGDAAELSLTKENKNLILFVPLNDYSNDIRAYAVLHDKDLVSIPALADLLLKPGFINLNLDDLKEFFRNVKDVYVLSETAEGVELAFRNLIASNSVIQSASKILLGVTTNSETSLSEISEGIQILLGAAKEDVEILWGHIINEDFDDKVKINLFIA